MRIFDILQNYINFLKTTPKNITKNIFRICVVKSKKNCIFAPAKRAQVVELVDTLL